MAEHLSPGDIKAHKFGTSRRGYDRAEVTDFLGRIGEQVGDLQGELAAISGRLNQLGITDLPDLKAEVEDVGVEVQTVLDAAFAAAEGLRTRAAQDAADLLSEADRAGQALRGDAWSVGTELLVQADSTSARLVAEAREDSLYIRAEAEQEAKRLVSEARRQADEYLRSSREDGERIVVLAKAESDAILEEARQAAEKAQQRARALETRRTELLTELEAAESTIRGLEEARTATSSPVERGGVRVIASGSDERTHWPEDEGAVRILPVDPVVATHDEPVDAEAIVAEVEEMRAAVAMPDVEKPVAADAALADDATELVEVDIREEAFGGDTESPAEQATAAIHAVTDAPAAAVAPGERTAESEVAAPVADDGGRTVPGAADVERAETAEDKAPPAGDRWHAAEEKVTIVGSDPGIDELFAKLRRPQQAPAAAVAEQPSDAVDRDDGEDQAEEPPPRLRVVPDVVVGEGFERRDRMLLSVENRGLRGLKRRIVELQNRVLEELRTSSGEFRLGRELVVEMMGDELDAVLADSFGAGHAAAAESLGLAEPQLTGGPQQGAAEVFTSDLHRDVRAVIDRDRGEGSRRLAADVGRVFRSWRTDEAERQVRQAARRAFNDGLLAGYRKLEVDEVEIVAPGRPCGECGAGAGITWRPGDTLPNDVVIPPAGPGCEAMIAPVGTNGFDSRSRQ